MKDFRKFFSKHYSAVSTKDELSGPELNKMRTKSNKSFKTNLNIIDSFFNKRKPGKITRSPKFGFLLLSGGLIAIVIGILVGIYHPYDVIFKWKLKFSEGGEIFSLWERPPVDLYIKIHLLNITNPNEYLAGKEKIKVQEVGPYVYKELMSHDDVSFNENGTVSTTPRHPLVYQEHLSEGHFENDTVIMLNIALLSIAQVAADKSYLFRLPINLLILQTKSQPIVKMTAREFMFGYETSLTTLGNTFLSDWISFDKVGLIDRMYDFSEDFETFYTGETEVGISGLYDTYMGSKHLSQWKGDHCTNIQNASDGTKFMSFLKPNETVKFFRKSMCRAQFLKQEGNETIVNNFRAFKYVFEDNAMDNGEIDERNKCYCRKGYCPPRGLLDVSDCYYGFPIALSYPHFMDSDPQLAEDVIGMQPNASKHSSYFMVQPETGLPLKLSVKFQINMHFRDVRSMAHVERFSHQTVPMLWFEIVLSELPEPLRNRFNLYLNILPHLDTLGFYLPIVGGILCVLCTIVQATLNLPQFISSTSKKIASSNKKHSYSKVLLRSGVYNACEVKLLEMNEKNRTKSQNNKLIINENQLLSKYNDNTINRDDYINNDAAMCQIDLSSEKNDDDHDDKQNDEQNKYALENEPVMSEFGYSSYKSNLSSRSNSCQQLANDLNEIRVDNSCDNDDPNYKEDNDKFEKEMMQNRLVHSNSTNNDEEHQHMQRTDHHETESSCLLGETSSLIDEIGHIQFNNDVNTKNNYYDQYEEEWQQQKQQYRQQQQNRQSNNDKNNTMSENRILNQNDEN